MTLEFGGKLDVWLLKGAEDEGDECPECHEYALSFRSGSRGGAWWKEWDCSNCGYHDGDADWE